jgi:hypothetical protein
MRSSIVTSYFMFKASLPFSFIHVDTRFVSRTFQSRPVPTLILPVRNMLDKIGQDI